MLRELGRRILAWLRALLERIGAVVEGRLPPVPGASGELPAAVVAERFELIRLAGRGGMGSVYRARDRRTGDVVALKLLHAAEAEGRFEREAQVLADLEHPHIVRYLAHGVGDQGLRYLAMEWLDGEDLSQRLRPGPLPVDKALLVAERVAEALGAAHALGVVHRDVKPSNVFFVGGDLDQPRLLDFGVARRDDAMLRTTTGLTVGTPSYMAPEQARGERDVDARADVFSLGCVLYECLTGKSPFESSHVLGVLLKILLEAPPPLQELRADVPPPVEALVARMLAKERAARPADGAAAAQAVATVRADPDALSGAADAVAPRRASPAATVGHAERRVTCVALVAGEEADLDSARRAVEPLDGRVDRLAEGTLLITARAAGGSHLARPDEAVQIGRCALAVHEVMPGARIALLAGLGEAADQRSLAGAIERGVPLLGATRGTDGGIALDEAMAALLEPRFEVRRSDTEGGAQAAEGERAVAELIAPRAAGARTLLGKATPCVGRDRELAALEATFETCVSERSARAVLVTAAAGVGKTRLALELSSRLRERRRGPEIWTAAADPVRASPPFGVAAALLRGALGESGEAAEAAAALAREPADRALFLRELLGLRTEGPEPAALRAARQDPALMSDRLAEAWSEFFRVRAEARPVLLWVDDLQWSDAASVKLLGSAIRDAADAPWMLVALARPEVHETFPRLWAGRSLEEVRLGELSRQGSVRLVRAVLGDTVTARRAEELAERAAGNAFYLEELIRAAARGEADALPGSVLAMVQARLGELPDELRRLLRVASVFGATFPAGGAAHLAGVGPGAARAALDELAELELVTRLLRTTRGADWSFRHALVRDAAHATLTDDDRALGHRLAADWLESNDAAPAAELAAHLERGGELARAATRYLEAALRALEASDLAAALALAERGVACGASGRELGVLRRVQAEAHVWRGELGEAERAGLEAMQYADDDDDGLAEWFAAVSVLTVTRGRLGADARLLEVAEQICAREPAQPDVHAVSAAERTAAYLLFSGHGAPALELLAWVERAGARLADDDPAMFWVEMGRGFRAQAAGDLCGARDARVSLLRRSERVGDARGACMARVLLGDALLELGDNVRAASELTEAARAASSRGLFHTEALARQVLATAQSRLGDHAAARALLAQALEAFRGQKNARMEAACHTQLSSIALAEADPAEALAAAERAVELSPRDTPARAVALAAKARALAAAGRAGEARASADAANALRARFDTMLAGQALVRLARVEALRAAGDDAASERAAAEAGAWLEQCAAGLGDGSRAFVQAIPEHRRILSLREGAR